MSKIPVLLRRAYAALVWALSIAAVVSLSQAAMSPLVLPPGTVPADVRLGPLKDLDGYFPFKANPSREEWEQRSAQVRRHILVSLGLWPMPTRTPLNAVVHGKVEREDYTVEKVYFESLPGFYVTGSLYRPRGRTGKLAGVLSPHGHWDKGRFHDSGVDAVRREIVQGGERFEEGGRSPLQARCVQLARMGCVVFHYDMIGYADSQQISFDLAHRFAKQRPEMNTTRDWGLYSPQAEAHLQSVMGLQTYNSIRALDFLLELPEVDSERIGVTGASGGGTQTFILGAIDPRPTVAFPAVMVSTAMQGGCTCENACLLRVGTGNVEMAALFAPKPQGLTAADDWTKEMATKGFPELKQQYAYLGAADKVMLKPLLHFGHNYNYVSRAGMYNWFNKHLALGLKDPIVEEDYKRLSVEEMSVWDTQHPKPASGPEFEKGLLRWLTEDSEKQLNKAQETLGQYQEVAGGAVDVLIGRGLGAPNSVTFEMGIKVDRGAFLEMSGLLRNGAYGEELPAVFLHPKNWNGQTVVWVSKLGKKGLYTAEGELSDSTKELIGSGATVVGVDLLYQGEFLADGKPLDRTRKVANPREFAGYTLGFNHSLFAQRVHDILTVLTFVRDHETKSKRVDLVGLEGAGHWVAAARAQAGAMVSGAVIDTGGFRFGNLRDAHDLDFLPGGAKYGDVPGLLMLTAPGLLWLAGETETSGGRVAKAYEQTGAQGRLTLYRGNDSEKKSEALRWLIGQSAL